MNPEIMSLPIQLDLTIGELTELIECAALCKSNYDWEPAIMPEIRDKLTELLRAVIEPGEI